MNVLILGSGGREHALAWKIAQSKLLSKLYIAPGNGGTAQLGTNVNLDMSDFESIRKFVVGNHVDVVVIGPEAPLVEGLHDYFLQLDEDHSITIIGPVKQAAMLEGSKDFAKAFMKKHGIPTARYRSFTKDTLEEAITYLQELDPPFVLKADGLAAGKGVLILDSKAEVEKELDAMLNGNKFGKAGEKVVIEEFLKGIELSVFVLTDGNSYLLLPEAKDYKRIGEGDTGKNTGGMGSISPVPFADRHFMDKVIERIVKPTIEGLQSDGISYKGFIFFGLMNVEGDPYVIEYNARLGDPEAESILPRIESDLLELFVSIGEEKLQEKRIDIKTGYSAAIMAVSGGYPENYEKGKVISGLDEVKDCLVFMAGTTRDETAGNYKTSGGRVLAVTGQHDTLDGALQKAYKNIKKIDFDKIYYRRDLGKDLQ